MIARGTDEKTKLWIQVSVAFAHRALVVHGLVEFHEFL